MGASPSPLSSREPVTFSTFRVFRIVEQLTGCFLNPSQIRHPERSAARISHNERFMARSRRACPERSRGNPGDACWQMLFGAFQPQTSNEVKKSQAPSEAEGSAVLRTIPGNVFRQRVARSGGTCGFFPFHEFSHYQASPKHFSLSQFLCVQKNDLGHSSARWKSLPL
jgi:hypothetical protein